MFRHLRGRFGSNQTVQRMGASRFAQRQIERHRRLAPIADLCVLLKMSNRKANPLKWSVDWNNLRQMERLLMWFPLLGPQRRIYQDLLRQLKGRHQDVEPWERLGPEVRDAAKRVTQILKDHLGWPPSAVFLPQDPADIPFWDR